MAKIIAAASPFQGHVGPLLTVSSDLIQRGHEIVFFTGSAFSKQAKAIGAESVPFPKEIDFDGRSMSKHFPEYPTVSPGPDMGRFYAKRTSLDPMKTQYQILKQLLETFPARVIIHDLTFLGAFPFVLGPKNVTRPITIGLGVLPPFLYSEEAVPFGFGVSQSEVEGDPEQIRQLNESARKAFADVDAYANTKFASLGLPLQESFNDSINTVPDHFFQLTVPGFEYPRSNLPKSFRFIGALPVTPAHYFTEPQWWSELNSSRPVVVVTQGTLANENLTDLIIPTIRGLADANMLVVAVTAREDGPDEVHRIMGDVLLNTKLLGYIPFDKLLPHADVMITNGGYGGVHVALHHGLPLVVAGETEDKLDVASRVQWCGAGLNLRTGRPTEQAVRRAVDTVFEKPSFKKMPENSKLNWLFTTHLI